MTSDPVPGVRWGGNREYTAYLQPKQLEAMLWTLLNEVMKLVPYELDFPASGPVAHSWMPRCAYPERD